jgi:hypothetical protein
LETLAIELEVARLELGGRWTELKKAGVADLNRLLEKEKAGKIDPERREENAPSTDVDGDDEP